ncbi:NAD(P)/FAD-dependent oxidoreductase [Flavobacteriaceae bacterium TK19130]|nr:NAD(P)/FAD-dependent oxidoreductase [Thermobacterium salinum]
MTAAHYSVLIIGGGIAGSTAALYLATLGVKVLVIEKQQYPNHKVCGEYVSKEVMPFLSDLGIEPSKRNAVAIDSFLMTNTNGKTLKARLPQGGFGISRYAFDEWLYEEASAASAEYIFETVTSCTFQTSYFEVKTQENSTYHADYVLGAFGKRSNLDQSLNRPFMKQKSPWLGVKMHYECSFQTNQVALHHFEGGYCGLSKTESGAVNLCYLASYDTFKRFGDIAAFQQSILRQNPFLDDFLKEAEPLFEAPITIGQISFEEKEPVVDGILMIGDSAGLIHPLCGNGMAMAIHAAKIAVEIVYEASTDQMSREAVEAQYQSRWTETFHSRLKMGRRLQNALLNETVQKGIFTFGNLFPRAVPYIISKTHGKPIA